MLVGSLLLHIFQFISSLLYTRRPAASVESSLLVKRSRALIFGQRGLSGDCCFAANGDGDGALQEERLFDEGGAQAPQEDCYQDDDDDQGNCQSGKVDGLLKEVGDNSPQMLIDSLQEVGDPLQEVGDPLQKLDHNLRLGDGDSPQPEADSLQEPADHSLDQAPEKDHSLAEVGFVLDNNVGDSLQAAPLITTLLSPQPSALFPSDLPPTLDPVVTAAAGSQNMAASASSIKPRNLPPTFSNVEKVLQEMTSQSHPQKRRTAGGSAATLRHGAELEAGAESEAVPDPAVRAASDDKFMAKFNQHFKRDGNG